MKEERDQRDGDPLVTCDVCGREVEPESVQIDEDSGQFICSSCLREDESCGCSGD